MAASLAEGGHAAVADNQSRAGRPPPVRNNRAISTGATDAMADQATYEFTVNGTLIKTPHEKLMAADVIRLAIEYGAATGKPEDYVLVSLDPDRQFKSDDSVDLLDYKGVRHRKIRPHPSRLNPRS